jgi:hypothetical protein
MISSTAAPGLAGLRAGHLLLPACGPGCLCLSGVGRSNKQHLQQCTAIVYNAPCLLPLCDDAYVVATPPSVGGALPCVLCCVTELGAVVLRKLHEFWDSGTILPVAVGMSPSPRSPHWRHAVPAHILVAHTGRHSQRLLAVCEVEARCKFRVASALDWPGQLWSLEYAPSWA